MIVVFLQKTLQEAFGMKGEDAGWAGGGNGYVAVEECQDRRGRRRRYKTCRRRPRGVAKTFLGGVAKKTLCAPD